MWPYDALGHNELKEQNKYNCDLHISLYTQERKYRQFDEIFVIAYTWFPDQK